MQRGLGHLQVTEGTGGDRTSCIRVVCSMFSLFLNVSQPAHLRFFKGQDISYLPISQQAQLTAVTSKTLNIGYSNNDHSN